MFKPFIASNLKSAHVIGLYYYDLVCRSVRELAFFPRLSRNHVKIAFQFHVSCDVARIQGVTIKFIITYHDYFV